MLLRVYLYTLFFITLLFWIIFAFVLFYTNPNKSEPAVFWTFFGSLFLALLGALTLFGFYLRLKFYKKAIGLPHFKSSFRQGLLISILAVGILGFSAMSILTWWTVSLLFIIIFLLELVFKTR